MEKIDFEVTIENYDSDIRKLYTMLRPKVRPEEVQCSGFDVGIMNRVVKMDDPISKDPIVFRIFDLKILETMTQEEREEKKGKPSTVNRELELEAVKKASELGITVKLCATFLNGFVYHYVDGEMLTIESYDFELAKKIATNIAKFHRMDLGELARKQPVGYWHLGKEGDSGAAEKERQFLDQKMKESEFEEFRSYLPNFSELSREVEKIHELLLQKDAYGRVFFCHNDLNITNLLVTPEKEPVLLDFEWANTNYQLYDITGHLFSISHRLGHFFKPGIPSEQFIKHWLRSYHEEANRLDGRRMTEAKFEEFIENEYKKVLAIMLLIRLLVIQISLQFTLMYPGQIPIGPSVKYVVDVYDDFKANRDKHLRLLDTLQKF